MPVGRDASFVPINTYLCIYAIRYLPASNGRRRRHIRQKPVAPALQVTLWHNNIHNIIIISRRRINTFFRVQSIISWFVARIKKLGSHRVCKCCVINYDDLSVNKINVLKSHIISIYRLLFWTSHQNGWLLYYS